MSPKSLVIAVVGAGSLAVAVAAGYYAGRLEAPGFDEQAAADAAPAPPAPLTAQPEQPVEDLASDAAPEPTPPAAAPRAEPRRAVPRRAQQAVSERAPEPVTERTVPDEDLIPALPPPTPAVTLPGSSEIPLPAFEPEATKIELWLERDAVIGVRLETLLTSETARVEDRVVAIVSREVRVDGRTAIPAGSRVEGHVTEVERGGRFRERGRIGIAFTTLVREPGERLPIVTEVIFREGDAPAAEATAKIGAGAVVGSILGAVVGGKKGAAIGGAAGAAGGTAVVAKGDRSEATLAEGTRLTLRLLEPVAIIVDR